MGHHEFRHGGYSGIPEQHGKLVEEDFFGKVRESKEFETIIAGSYVTFKDALKEVKSYQPNHPENPGKPFAKELRIELLDLLKLATQEEFRRLRFYTAVGSDLDVYHGSDAFFEYDETLANKYEHKTIRIMLGVTTRQKNIEDLKTDVELFVPPDGFDEDSKEFYTAVSRAAKTISDVILKKTGPVIVDLRF